MRTKYKNVQLDGRLRFLVRCVSVSSHCVHTVAMADARVTEPTARRLMCLFEVVPSMRDVRGDPSVSMRAPPPCSARVVAMPTAGEEQEQAEEACAYHDDKTAVSWGWNTLRLEREATPEEEALELQRYAVMLSCCRDHATQDTSLPFVDHAPGASYAHHIVKPGTTHVITLPCMNPIRLSAAGRPYDSRQ